MTQPMPPQSPATTFADEFGTLPAEPGNGAIVMVGGYRQESVYIRDDDHDYVPGDTPAPVADRWFPVQNHIAFGRSWADIVTGEKQVQQLVPAVEFWISVHRTLDDAHSAADNPDFEAGIKFAASVVADALGVSRPPWAS